VVKEVDGLKHNDTNGPLNHIRVLDLTQTLAGPFASTILGDLGAEVIKIERPIHGDQTRHFSPFQHGQSHYFISVNRNKKSVELDIKGEKGKELFLELVTKCDVLLENFRPGVLDKLGIGHDVIRANNENMIICSISAFGHTGPYRNKPGYDLLIQAMSGVMSLTGYEGSPVRCGLPIGDLIGGLYGAIAVLGAIVEKQKTGKGLIADLSLLDNLVSLLGYFAGKYYITGKPDGPVGSYHPFVVPYGTFESADGFLVIAIYTEEFWRKFANAIQKPEWLTDVRFKSNDNRVENRDILLPLIQQILISKPISWWSEVFEKYDIPFAPILDVEQVLNHEQIKARGLIKGIEHPEYGSFSYVGTPIQYINEPLENNTAPPSLGEHTEEVLINLLGYESKEIKEILRHSKNSN
jgi:crotonobetainyl-CoA:carnitine CoA-transferase CaiB-like acyl-CoA transferase